MTLPPISSLRIGWDARYNIWVCLGAGWRCAANRAVLDALRNRVAVVGQRNEEGKKLARWGGGCGCAASGVYL